MAQSTRIQVATRVADVLTIVSRRRDGMSATDVARELELPTATVFHLLQTLVDGDLLAKYDKRYVLGPRIGVLGEAYWNAFGLPAHLHVALQRLADVSGETAYATTWRGGEVVVLHTIEGRHPVTAAAPRRGFSGHAHARASGRALLSTLDSDALDAYLAAHSLDQLTKHTITSEDELRREIAKARRRGYAIDNEEFHEGLSCLAAPVVVGDATLVAMGIAVPTARFRRARAALIEAVRQAVQTAAQSQ